MQIDEELLNHPYWKESDPSGLKVVHLSREFPPELNFFADDGVVICAAGVPNEHPDDSDLIQDSKSIIGREAVLAMVQAGRVHRKDPATGKPTILVEATSANTGKGMARTCAGIEHQFIAIVKSDTPPPKVEALERSGRGFARAESHSDLNETTVQRARRMGLEPGYCNPDQYAGDWNWKRQAKTMAPQLYGQFYERYGHEPSLVGDPAGTMGTSIGLYKCAESMGLNTIILPTMCAPKQEVPGARTMASILSDIRIDWQSIFGDRVETGPRYESFLLSHLTWPVVPQNLGPSFGLGFYGALSFLWKHKLAGTLDSLRKKDGKIYVVLFGPDNNVLYRHVYPSVLSFEDYAQRRPLTPERLFVQAA